jgi:hypothetical protein
MDYAFIVLIASVFIARFIQISAFKNLADEDKPKVMSKNIMQLSQASLLFTVILIVSFYLTASRFGANYTLITSSFFAALLLQRIVVYIISRKRMIENGVPSSYLSKYFLSWLVTTSGVILFIVLLMWQFTNGSR